MNETQTANPARNASLLVVSSGLRAALFPIPIITLFWKDEIGITLSGIMWLQAIFGAAAVLVEFPSGYVADRLGYRFSMLSGAVLCVGGWLAYAVGTTFAGMALAEVLLGMGLAFISGADSALLFASVQRSDDLASYRRWEGRVRAAAQTSEAISSAAGGWLYSLAPRLPFWIQVPVAIANAGVIAVMREPSRSIAAERVRHLVRAWHIVRHALIRHARLRTAMALSVALGVSTYIAVWLIQPWMQRRGIPAVWVGPLWAAAHLWLAAVSLVSGRVAEVFGARLAWVLCCRSAKLLGTGDQQLADRGSVLFGFHGCARIAGTAARGRIAERRAGGRSCERAIIEHPAISPRRGHCSSAGRRAGRLHGP
jgi:MFS family permease